MAVDEPVRNAREVLVILHGRSFLYDKRMKTCYVNFIVNE